MLPHRSFPPCLRSLIARPTPAPVVALLQDENGAGYAVGTGQGVCRHQMPRIERVPALQKWAAKPGTDGRVPRLAELVGDTGAGSEADLYNLGRDAWRSFRLHLDHCVHYAECRLCELVSLLT